MIRFKNLSYNIFMKGILKMAFIVLLVVVFLFAFIVIYFMLAFKTDYKEFVLAEAQKNDIDPALVFAIIKAESKFNRNAKSKANAIGLMQIRLETANYVCEINGENIVTESELFVRIGKLTYLACNNGKSASRLTGSCSLYRSIKRKQVCLACDL